MLTQQQTRLLSVMREKGSISSLEAFNLAGSVSLQKRLSELREKGYSFTKRKVFPEGKKWYYVYGIESEPK